MKGNIFIVEKIVKKKLINGEEYGLVKWEGFLKPIVHGKKCLKLQNPIKHNYLNNFNHLTETMHLKCVHFITSSQ